jgi:hypothetical protein
MKKILISGLALGALAFTSCNATNEENTTINDTAVVATDGMVAPATTSTTTTRTITMDEKGNPYGTIYSTDGTVKVMGKGYQMDEKGNPYGTTYNTDGTVNVMGVEVYPDGNTTNSAAQGETITLDGRVNDRDGDGKVGTAEVKEAAQNVGNAVEKGAKKVGNAVQKGAQEVKGEYKDVRDGQNNH